MPRTSSTSASPPPGDGREVFASPHRDVCGAELDLMARLAGLTLVGRRADCDRAPVTGESSSHVSVWRTDA